MKNLLGAGRVQHRAVDGEQHDVGGGDVQRHSVEAGRLDERCADDLVPVHAGVRDRRALRQVAAVVGVAEGEQAHDRQRDARGPAAGLQHQQNHDRPDDRRRPSQACPADSGTRRIHLRRRRIRRAAPGTGMPPMPPRRAASRPASGCASCRRCRSSHDAGAAVQSGSTTASAAAPPPGTRSVRPGCPARAGRTPDRSRTARPAHSRRPPRGRTHPVSSRAGFSSS